MKKILSLVLWYLILLFFWPVIQVHTKNKDMNLWFKGGVQIFFLIIYYIFLIPGLIILLSTVLKIYTNIAWKLHGPMEFTQYDERSTLCIPADKGNEPFNKDNWNDTGSNFVRLGEIEKLIKQKILEDKTQAEIIQLLGQPSTIYTPYNRLIYHLYIGPGFSKLNDLTIFVTPDKPNVVYFEYYEIHVGITEWTQC